MSWLPLLVLLGTLDPELSLPQLAETEGEAEPSFADRIGFGAELAFASTYVYRGEIQYRNGTTPSFQPSLWVALEELGPGELELGLWSAIALADWERIDAEGSSTEVDFSLLYRAGLFGDRFFVKGGFAYYVYPSGRRADGEKQILVEFGLGEMPVTPSVAFWTEVHPGLGLHIEPRLSWEQEIGSATVSTDLSMGASIYRDEEARLDHGTLTLGLEHAVGEIACAVALSYTIRLAAGQGSFMDRSLVWGTLAFRYEL